MGHLFRFHGNSKGKEGVKFLFLIDSKKWLKNPVNVFGGFLIRVIFPDKKESQNVFNLPLFFQFELDTLFFRRNKCNIKVLSEIQDFS